MIRIVKSTDTPAVLTTTGITEKAKNCQLYLARPTEYDNGTATFDIKSTIYGDASVKQQLIAEQHGKCCFCEADFTANGYGDVEHFRPKAGYTKTPDSKLSRPGYYWLAYEWNNLFFSCQICNQRFKKNYFPLDDEIKRAKNHTLDYLVESPLLLHPSIDNPEDHITFNRHVPVAATDSKRGEVSIISFGIDRPSLNKKREEHLQNVRNNILLASFNPSAMTRNERDGLVRQTGQPWDIIESLIMTAKAFVRIAADENQPFAAMVRANFPNLI